MERTEGCNINVTPSPGSIEGDDSLIEMIWQDMLKVEPTLLKIKRQSVFANGLVGGVEYYTPVPKNLYIGGTVSEIGEAVRKARHQINGYYHEPLA